MIHIYRNHKSYRRDERLRDASASAADANAIRFIFVPAEQYKTGGKNK